MCINILEYNVIPIVIYNTSFNQRQCNQYKTVSLQCHTPPPLAHWISITFTTLPLLVAPLVPDEESIAAEPEHSCEQGNGAGS